ncbi:MAG: hypothetical protein ACLR8P_00555 [Clostridium fessum]
MKKILHWLDENLEEFLLVVMLAAMTLIMGIQIFSRYALGQSLSHGPRRLPVFSLSGAVF